MNSSHNPIARIIENLRSGWQEETGKNEEYKLFCWLIKPEEAALINGFYQLESSQYGSLPEFFLVMTSPFGEYDDYARLLVSDIIRMWEQDETVKSTQTGWDISGYKQQLARGNCTARSLCDMLTDFHTSICQKEQTLVFGLVPQSVDNFDEYNHWLLEVSTRLPENIKLSVVDHIGKDYLKPVRKKLKDKAIIFECGNLNLQGAMQQIATGGGNSNDPEIGFRECLFEMGDGVAAKNSKHVHKWGEKALEIAQRTGKKSFYATAYLVYAGSLLHFREDETGETLDKGIEIAEKAFQAGDRDCTAILCQLYGFKSAFYSTKGKKGKAGEWMFKQAVFAVENQLGAYAISVCRMSASLAKKNWDDELYDKSIEMGYQAGTQLTDEELKVSEIATLAYYYAEKLEKSKELERAKEIRDRMKALFGEGWDENILPLSARQRQSIPNMEETLKNLKT